MTDSLAALLEREHRAIDEDIAAFASADAGTEALHRATEVLRRHIYLEEELLFPSLRAAGLVMPVFVMVREHAEMWPLLDAVDAAAAEGGDDAAARDLCRQLVALLDAHNGKEEQILYPQADAVVAEPAADDIRDFLAAGQVPAGWMCEGRRG